MTFALAFWIGMFLWLVLGLWSNWPINQANSPAIVGSLLLFILVGLLGWHDFGAPIHQ